MTESGRPRDFMDELGVTPPMRSIIERSAQEYETTGEWVSFDTLAYEAAAGDHDFDLNQVFRIPSSLGGAWSQEKVNLTGLGLVLAGTAPGNVALMVRLAEICSERKMHLREDAKLGRRILIDEYGFSDGDAVHSQDLMAMLPGMSGGGRLGDDWELTIFRTALDYRRVHSADELRGILEDQARERISMHAQAIAAAPAFAPGGIFSETFEGAPLPSATSATMPQPDDPTAVFVVHGRDLDAKIAIWGFLRALGLHPLDWEDDLVALTGQGSPFIGQILDAAFARAQAVIVLMTPDDCARLHPDLHLDGELDFELRDMGQARPNVLFEAGMAFGFCPTRTILVEVGSLRPVSDLGGRHTVRIGTESTLRDLARRLEVAGCRVDRSDDSWLEVARFSSLAARSRTP